MREKIICRFETEDNFNIFCKLNNVELLPNTIYYNFKTKEMKTKRVVKSRPPKDEE